MFSSSYFTKVNEIQLNTETLDLNITQMKRGKDKDSKDYIKKTSSHKNLLEEWVSRLINRGKISSGQCCISDTDDEKQEIQRNS